MVYSNFPKGGNIFDNCFASCYEAVLKLNKLPVRSILSNLNTATYQMTNTEMKCKKRPILYEQTVYFLPLSFQKFLVLI